MWSFGSEFPAICNHCELWRPEVARPGNFVTTPYGKSFKILFWKFTQRRRLMLLCSNVKFVRREMVEIVRYLPHKKKLNFGCLSNCLYCVDSAQNLLGPAPNNLLTVLLISSKFMHFRSSSSRTRELLSPQGKSIIRRKAKHSFAASKNYD